MHIEQSLQQLLPLLEQFQNQDNMNKFIDIQKDFCNKINIEFLPTLFNENIVIDKSYYDKAVKMKAERIEIYDKNSIFSGWILFPNNGYKFDETQLVNIHAYHIEEDRPNLI